MNDLFLFGVFPYAALAAAGVGVAARRRFPATLGTRSSEFLEKKVLFWGSVPWHYAIILILLAHLLAALVPGPAGILLGNPAVRTAIELAGMALALLALFGILTLIVRRMPRRRLARASTSPMDWILLAALLLQVSSGFAVALFDRWGSMWYLGTAVPWFWSIVALRPDPSTVAMMPTLVQFHFVLGFVVILLFPFTRLVHLVSVPVGYLWRPYQLVVWNAPPGGRRGDGNPGK